MKNEEGALLANHASTIITNVSLFWLHTKVAQNGLDRSIPRMSRYNSGWADKEPMKEDSFVLQDSWAFDHCKMRDNVCTFFQL